MCLCGLPSHVKIAKQICLDGHLACTLKFLHCTLTVWTVERVLSCVLSAV